MSHFAEKAKLALPFCLSLRSVQKDAHPAGGRLHRDRSAGASGSPAGGVLPDGPKSLAESGQGRGQAPLRPHRTQREEREQQRLIHAARPAAHRVAGRAGGVGKSAKKRPRRRLRTHLPTLPFLFFIDDGPTALADGPGPGAVPFLGDYTAPGPEGAKPLHNTESRFWGV